MGSNLGLGVKTLPHISKYHRLGNVISALLSLVESIITILSLGFLYPRLNIPFQIWRMDTIMYDNRKGKE